MADTPSMARRLSLIGGGTSLIAISGTTSDAKAKYLAVKQGPQAHGVGKAVQTPGPAIPDRKGKLANQSLGEACTPFQVGL